MEALCVSMTTSPYGFDPFPVVSGNVTVHPARYTNRASGAPVPDCDRASCGRLVPPHPRAI